MFVVNGISSAVSVDATCNRRGKDVTGCGTRGESYLFQDCGQEIEGRDGQWFDRSFGATGGFLIRG